jgi:lipopolysaccharide biosynthesis glycosyltransferase
VPLDKKEKEDAEKSIKYYDILYDYSGESILNKIGKLSFKELFSLAEKTIEALRILEEEGCYTNLKPGNILLVGKDSDLKIIYQSFPKFDAVAKAKSNNAFIDQACIYWPPEAFFEQKSVNEGPIEVYMWGMLFYQLLAKKSIIELFEEIENYKKNIKNYQKFLRNLECMNYEGKNEANSKQGKAFASIIRFTLDIQPEKRPSFKKLKELFQDPGNIELLILQDENAQCKKELEIASQNYCIGIRILSEYVYSYKGGRVSSYERRADEF